MEKCQCEANEAKIKGLEKAVHDLRNIVHILRYQLGEVLLIVPIGDGEGH